MPKARRGPAPRARPRFTSRVVCWRVRCRSRCFGRCWIRCTGSSRASTDSALQRQKNIIQRVGPGGDSEPTQQVERAEEKTGDDAKGERGQRKLLAVGAHVVERRKDESAHNYREEAGALPRPAQCLPPNQHQP